MEMSFKEKKIYIYIYVYNKSIDYSLHRHFFFLTLLTILFQPTNKHVHQLGSTDWGQI